MLGRLGFGGRWRRWMHACISTTSFAVVINGDLSSFFKISQSLRQGDPLSPLLFIIVMETLNMMLGSAK